MTAEIRSLTRAVNLHTEAIKNHNDAIADLYAIQDHIIKTLPEDLCDSHVTRQEKLN